MQSNNKSTKIFFFIYFILTLFITQYALSASFFKGPALIEGLTITATAGGTTTLTKDSETNQQFTGVTNQTLVLPDATTLPLGRYFQVENRSTGTVTVQTNGGGALTTVLPNMQKQVLVTSIGTSAGSWDVTNLKIDLSDVANVTGILALANGGTNKSITASAGSVAYSDADSFELSAVGTSGQALISGGTGAPTWYAPTAGSVLFGGTSGILSQDNSYFYYDSTNHRLGIGVGASENTITISGTSYGNTLAIHAEGTTDGAEVTVHRHSSTAALGSHFIGARSRGAEASETVVQSGDFLTRFDGVGFDGTDYEIGAQIDFKVDGTPGSNDMPGNIVLLTTPDGSATPAQRMIVKNNGQVAIGSSDPTTSAILDLQGTTGALLIPRLTTTQKNALTASAGMIVYDTTLARFECYSSSWIHCGVASPLTTKGDLFTFSTVNTRLPAGTDNFSLKSNSGTTTGLQWEDTSSSIDQLNLSIATSVSGNALTIAVKNASGSDASSTSPIRIGFRSSTLTSGIYNIRSITGSLSMTVSSGSTLGTTNSNAATLWIYAIDNAGTVEIAISQALYGESTLVTTTAEGGAGAADSNATIYSTTARTNVPVRLIGKLISTQTTAGTWAVVPTNTIVGTTGRLSSTNRVVASYTGAPPTGTLNGSFNTVIYGTKVADTHSAYSSGSFTVPEAGFFDISAQVEISASRAIGDEDFIGVYIDGTNIGNAKQASTSIGTKTLTPQITIIGYPLNAGQVVEIRAAAGTASPSYTSTASRNYFSIKKSGDL